MRKKKQQSNIFRKILSGRRPDRPGQLQPRRPACVTILGFQEGKPQGESTAEPEEAKSFISKDFILTCFAEETKVGRPSALPPGCVKYAKILILENPCLWFGKQAS